VTRPSVWEDRNPRTPAPAAEVEGAVDVVVIGGGLTGLTTALLLGRAGRRVVVLEADRVGAGTTGRSTAKVSLLQGTRLSQISSKHPESVVRDYVEGNREAQAWVERFCEEHGVGLQHRAAYTYAHGGRGERQVRQEHEAAQRAGLPTEWVAELGLPYPTRGAVRLADQVQLDPLELVQALAREAEAHGVGVVEGARALEVSGGGPYRVATEHGSLDADTVVVATNMPMLDRGGFFARMKPARSYGLTFRTPEPLVDGMYLSADQPSRSLRDVPDGPDGSLLMVGGNGHPTGRGGSTEQRLDELRAWTAEHWPGAVETHAWSAQDFMPHHELPFAGPLVPGNDHLLMAGGYSKWGMTNAVAASLALSGRILGGHLEWAEAWRTWRGHEVRGLAKAAMVNAEVGWHMAQGWVKPVLPGRRAPLEEGQGAVQGDGLLRRPVAVSRTDGQERTVSAVCTHLGGIVSWNDAERSWDCPLHGSRFDADGTVLDAPATCGLARRSQR
jgi:glycine/D-amino acid oxidase-like deaminating enzyme/nitrite reductase/ring-hydroxylating ferredoxin subunit